MVTNIVPEADRIPDAVLFSKMAKVMGAMSRLHKGGKNDHFGYKFATSEDVADMVRKELAEQNIAFFASMKEVRQEVIVRKSKNGERTVIRTYIVFEFTFACGDTGAIRTSTWHAESEDDSDKGINKAATAAEKYFLMKTFVLSSGDEKDADKEGSRGQLQTKAQRSDVRWQDDPERKDFVLRKIGEIIGEEDVEARALALIGFADWYDFDKGNDALNAVRQCWAAHQPAAQPKAANGHTDAPQVDATGEDKPANPLLDTITCIYVDPALLEAHDVISLSDGSGLGKRWTIKSIGSVETIQNKPTRKAVLTNGKESKDYDFSGIGNIPNTKVVGGPKFDAAREDRTLVQQNGDKQWVWQREHMEA